MLLMLNEYSLLQFLRENSWATFGVFSEIEESNISSDYLGQNPSLTKLDL